jgi:hypothetical protein
MLLSRGVYKRSEREQKNRSTEMMPKEKMALQGVDILPSLRKARATEPRAVKEEQGRFHEVSWRS